MLKEGGTHGIENAAFVTEGMLVFKSQAHSRTKNRVLQISVLF